MGRPRTATGTIDTLATHPGKFVSPRQLAEYLNVDPRTIYYHIDKGALRARRIGGVLRIPIAEARSYACEPATLAS